MLIAYNDRIEIWDKDNYFDMINTNITDFADLADQVMGGINENE
jgi:DNA-binding transcriptional regulator/RsmH inhibitor MraZ